MYPDSAEHQQLRSGHASVRERVVIPLGDNCIRSEFVTFDGLVPEADHFAVLFSDPQLEREPLVRIHSECVTGDVFHSQRCDCGQQLDEALRVLFQIGGILIYLRQEGRGIGFKAKIDAYKLIDQGLDTYAANRKLGFPEDARSFDLAADMLSALGVRKLRLLSNNPMKVRALTEAGLDVVRMVPTGVFIGEFNRSYLEAKSHLGGHTISV